jgi:hypothetical protein
MLPSETLLVNSRRLAHCVPRCQRLLSGKREGRRAVRRIAEYELTRFNGVNSWAFLSCSMRLLSSFLSGTILILEIVLFVCPPTQGASVLGIINVKDFGAIGNSRTDDSTAIQRAIDVCATRRTPCIVYFPPGTYLLKSSLDVSSQAVTLQGQAQQSAQVGDAPAVAVLQWGGAATRVMVRLGDQGHNGWAGNHVEHLSFNGGQWEVGRNSDPDRPVRRNRRCLAAVNYRRRGYR